jgi:hypothetical protein
VTEVDPRWYEGFFEAEWLAAVVLEFRRLDMRDRTELGNGTRRILLARKP